MKIRLSEIAGIIGAQWSGDDQSFATLSTDTRTLQAGDLFIALTGERFDGNTYVESAAQAGAVAAVVSKPQDTAITQLVVEDTRKALGQIAHYWRQLHKVKMVAVTGSNGKTTVKEMLASILSTVGNTLFTLGNFNNDIGVPLTLMRLNDQHAYAVIEMGANHHGEIAYLTQVANPDVAIVNNAGPAHLEGFGSLDGVATAKGEIFSNLRQDGIGIVNIDDPRASVWLNLLGERSYLRFGIDHPADIRAVVAEAEKSGKVLIRTPEGEFEVHLSLPGRHNIMNALAACAATHAMGISNQQIKAGLESMQAIKGRLQWRVGPIRAYFEGQAVPIKLLDDTYNANPNSLQAALDVLASEPGDKILILGDMAELGGYSEQLHGQVGTQAKKAGVNYLYAIGEFSRHAVRAFGDNAFHFDDIRPLVETVLARWQRPATALIKGSRSMHMEQAVELLLQHPEHKVDQPSTPSDNDQHPAPRGN